MPSAQPMRLRFPRPPSSRDPEKNGQDRPFVPRWISRLFTEDRPPLITGARPLPRDYSNENVFPRAFTHSDRREYSEAESQQTSAKLWSIYVDEALRYDSTLVDSWRADMEGMLIFSGLFSASLTAFIIESYRTLRPDTGDLTVQLLAQILHQLAGTNSSLPSLDESSAFKPTSASLICNTFWFISLSLSITCALLATLVEQWAREFLHRTEKRPSPIRRGRIFSFLYFGVRRFGMHTVVDVIPMLLHISMVLFLAGLVAFLLPINRIMMDIIIAIVCAFLAIYVILTILPIISLDCPYRTPFTEPLWNCVQIIQRRFHLSNSVCSPGSVSINDAMVTLALAEPEVRDQRAFIWTLESLTDDQELLPFLEAIPEAIHGAKGFHLVNDYIFIPLLDTPANEPSLGQRIGDLLLSCRNMVVDDPRRQRSFVAGMRAVWALGMIAGRTGPMFTQTGQFWFADAFNESRTEYPFAEAESYSQAENLAVCYSRANNLRHSIFRLMQEVAEGFGERPNFAQSIKDLVARGRNIRIRDPPEEYRSSIRSLAAWCNGVAGRQEMLQLRTILKSLTGDSLWLEMSVSLLCQFLLGAARTSWKGGNLPYEFLQSCVKIMPTVPTIPPLVHRPDIFHLDSRRYFDPSQYQRIPGQNLDLDWIMRSLLRVVPRLRPEDVVPIVVLYLERRDDREAVLFTTRECHLPLLFNSLSLGLNPGITGCDPAHVLNALFILLIHPQFRSHLSSWKECDDRLYDYMTENDVFTETAFQSLSTLVIIRRLIQLTISTQPLQSEGGLQQDDLRSLVGRLKIFASDPILSTIVPNDIFDSSATVGELQEAVLTRWAPRAALLALTNFVNGCVQPIRPKDMIETLWTICSCLPRTFTTVDPQIMSAFAGACDTLVDHLVQNSQYPGLKATTAKLLVWCDQALGQAETAHMLKGPMRSYLSFLQGQRDRDELEIEMAKDRMERWAVL